ncbi:MAG TPA: hypothetical protein PK970_03800 [Hyphomicrobiaceae bacterium]|nr:hypothetical protein [Hyphomicrobiaceae bacterium]
MREKLLTLELLVSGGAGLVLLLVPGLASRVLGWGVPSSLVWPRLTGAILMGLAVATAAHLAGWSKTGLEGGLGLAGHVAINFVVSFVLLSIAIVGAPMPTRRGRWMAALIALCLIVLGLAQIAHL